MCDADTSLWVGELHSHGVLPEEARVVSGKAGKMNPEMAKTPVYYCCYDLSRFTINAFQDFGVQAGISSEVVEER